MFQLIKKIKEITKRPAYRRGMHQAGMTYVELIVVLSIFSIMSSMILFNYGKFQAKVDIKNLANDIALKIVEAQKNALAGLWNASAPSSWKPAYGVYFDLNADNKRFTYFADLDNNNLYQNISCTGECLNNISITKGNRISNLAVTGQGTCSAVTNLSAVFTRPDSAAVIKTNQTGCTAISYAEITVSSPTSSVNSKIKLYSSGRIQIN